MSLYVTDDGMPTMVHCDQCGQTLKFDEPDRMVDGGIDSTWLDQEEVKHDEKCDKVKDPAVRWGFEKPTLVLTETNGNAFFVMGKAIRALRRAKAPALAVEAYKTEATSGDYDNVLATTMKWCEVE